METETQQFYSDIGQGKAATLTLGNVGFTVQPRHNDYKAFVTGIPSIWECAKTPEGAIGRVFILAVSHKDMITFPTTSEKE